MNPQLQTIAAGLAAGFASAALSAAMAGGGALLFMIAPLPILMASLGFGIGAGSLAAAICVGIVTVVASPTSGMLVALVIALPAAMTAQMANLARPADEIGGPSAKLVWFPLADILLWSALILGLGFVLAGMLAGFGPQFGALLAKAMQETIAASGQTVAIEPAQVEAIAAMATNILPAMLPGTWLALLMGNFYLAMAILTRTGMTRRPRDDWPTALRLPKSALPFFAVALAGAFLPGGWGHMASAFAGTLGAAFILAGFATLHARTRGADWRAPALGLAYVATAFFSPVLFLFLIAGLFDTRRQAVMSDAGSPPNPNS